MKLKELAQIIEGYKIIESHLDKNKNDSFLYLETNDLIIKEGTLKINEKSLFISKKNIQKFYNKLKNTNEIQLQYGDIVINTNKVNFFTFKDIEPAIKIIPNIDFLIIRPSNKYLSDTIEKFGKEYFINQFKKIFSNDRKDFIELVEKIEIPENLSNIEEIKNQGIRNDRKEVDIESINIKQGLMTLDKVLKRIKNNEINIETDTYFQRKANLWDDETKSRFIEVLIIKQPVPAFYFDCTDENKWLIVDGLQRLTTINKFINGEFALEDLFYLSNELEGKKYEDLPRWAERNIEEYEINVYRIEKPTPQEVKYKIFRAINTSALILEKQEIRHALNYGKPTQCLNKLTEFSMFKNLIPLSPKRIDRMEDKEFALRYLCFRITNYEDYKPDMTDFLDDSMTKINTITDEFLNQYIDEFGEALFTLHTIFGENCFKKNMIGLESDEFTQILYEIWVHAFAIISQEERDFLKNKKNKVITETKKLKDNIEFIESINNNKAYNLGSLKFRFKTIENFVKNLLKQIQK